MFVKDKPFIELWNMESGNVGLRKLFDEFVMSLVPHARSEININDFVEVFIDIPHTIASIC